MIVPSKAALLAWLGSASTIVMAQEKMSGLFRL